MTPMWNLWFATELKSWLVLTSLTSIYVTPLKCVSFEIIFKDFFLVAFAFTRFWFVGLFREQAQSWFVRRRVWGKKYKQEHAQGLWLGQQTFEQLVGEKLVHTFHFLTTFLLLFFFHTSCLLSVFEQRICTCVIQICLTPCFVLFLGLGQEAQQVVCRGLLAWGSKHIYFLIHTNCDLFFSCLFPCYVSVTSFSYLILSYQVFCHLICIIMCHFCCLFVLCFLRAMFFVCFLSCHMFLWSAK